MKTTETTEWSQLTAALGRGEPHALDDHGNPGRRRYIERVKREARAQGLQVRWEDVARVNQTAGYTRPDGPLVGGTTTTFYPSSEPSPVGSMGSA